MSEQPKLNCNNDIRGNGIDIVEVSNPYAPPESELETFIDFEKVWRDEKLIIMRKGAKMPDRCIHCNETVEPSKPRRILYLNIWLQIAMLVLFLVFNVVALIPILIVSAIFRKTARVKIPLCVKHRRKRLWITLTTVSLLLVSIALGVMAARVPLYQGELSMLATVIFVGAFVLAIIRGQLLSAKKIDKETVILKGAKPPFLDSLPQYPGQ
jgi:hypothetical protein